MSERGSVRPALQARIDAGGKCLVPYITGGFEGYLEAIQAAAAEGADAIEIGIPFSDPVMDGPVIQEANERVLARGITPDQIIDEVASLEVDVPLAVMTYYNIAFRFGLERFATTLTSAGIGGAILPDMPLREAGPWSEAADGAGVEMILLAAPTTTDDHLIEICAASRGFVYAVGLLGITGVREALAQSATVIAGRCKAVTEKPVLVGVGVGTPEQARQVTRVADGCVVGSAVVRELLDGRGPDGVGALVSRFRHAVDSE